MGRVSYKPGRPGSQDSSVLVSLMFGLQLHILCCILVLFILILAPPIRFLFYVVLSLVTLKHLKAQDSTERKDLYFIYIV